MQRRAAERLADKIAKECSAQHIRVQVSGLRNENGAYYVDCVDTATGYPFVVGSEQEWRERRYEADLDVLTRG